MNKTPSLSVGGAVLILIMASAVWMNAQNGPAIPEEEAIVEPIGRWAFPVLRRWGIDVVQNPAFTLAPEGAYLAADQLDYDPASGIVDVSGNVQLTMVRADGSMVRMTADSLQITEVESQ